MNPRPPGPEEKISPFQLALLVLSLVLLVSLTVGYGDRYPVTAGGRMIAMVLMVAGVGLFGTLSGIIGSYFVGPRDRQRDLQLILARLDEMERRLHRERTGGSGTV